MLFVGPFQKISNLLKSCRTVRGVRSYRPLCPLDVSPRFSIFLQEPASTKTLFLKFLLSLSVSHRLAQCASIYVFCTILVMLVNNICILFLCFKIYRYRFSPLEFPEKRWIFMIESDRVSEKSRFNLGDV